MTFNHYSFKPKFLLRNKYTQTILGAIVSGNTDFPECKLHKLLIDHTAKLVLFELPSNNPEATVVLLAHGMGGCSEASYMRHIARKLWIRGFTVFMMNQLGSGLGMGLSDRLWNGGSCDDLRKTVNYIAKIHPNTAIDVVGFSLSGNILLKLLGEKNQKNTGIRRAIAVNPPIDLKRASYFLSKTKWGRVFNNYYMREINLQVEAMGECFPDAFTAPNKSTILEFDEAYTAPAAGYKNSEDYYSDCSAKNYLEDIVVPTTILCAMDDPFIEPTIFKSVRMSSAIELNTPTYGGHMGYISKKPTPWGDYRWMDFMVVDWMKS
jgi:predicted alpha/beta-fold hydrolase